MIFTIFKQLLLAVMILFFDSSYTKTIHRFTALSCWLDFLTVLSTASWAAGYTAELAGCHADDAKNMEPARPQEMNHNHKKYRQKSQKWQCKDLLVNSNQGETWWNRLLWFGGADSNYFGSLWGRLMKCFFDELTVETKKEPEAPTGSQVVCVCVCVFFSHVFVCLSG